jgi:hypothetical protein
LIGNGFGFETKSIYLTQIHDRPLSLLGADTSIKSSGIKLVLNDQRWLYQRQNCHRLFYKYFLEVASSRFRYGTRCILHSNFKLDHTWPWPTIFVNTWSIIYKCLYFSVAAISADWFPPSWKECPASGTITKSAWGNFWKIYIKQTVTILSLISAYHH